MYEFVKDCRWVLKVVSSCNNANQIQTAKNCIKQLHIKWSTKMDTTDERFMRLYDEYSTILNKRFLKVEVKYGKQNSI